MVTKVQPDRLEQQVTKVTKVLLVQLEQLV